MLSTGVTLTRAAVPIAELTNIGTSHSRDALESTVHSAMRIVPIKNGGFETGDLTGWSDWNTPTTREASTTQAHSGTYSCHHVGPEINSGVGQSIASLVEMGETYTFSAWVYPVSSTSIRLMFAYQVDGGTEFNPQGAPSGTGAWERIAFTFTLPAGTTMDRCTLYLGGEGEAYFDDVRIHEVGAKTFQRGGIDGEELPIEGFFLGYDDAATEDIMDDLFDSTDTLASYAINITDADAGVTTITGDAFLTDLNITAGASEHAAFTGTIRWAGAPTYAYVP